MSLSSVHPLACAAMLLLALPDHLLAQRSLPDRFAYFPANGHYYERVDSSGLSWRGARDAAAARSYNGMRGHLVTITSAEENRVVFSLGDLIAYHFGGYQDTAAPDYREPDRGWRWVTGEPWDYAPWSPGEPSDRLRPTENFLVGWFGDGWNDGQGITERGYVVEYELEEHGAYVGPGGAPAGERWGYHP